jgi:hypothetical protein
MKHSDDSRPSITSTRRGLEGKSRRKGLVPCLEAVSARQLVMGMIIDTAAIGSSSNAASSRLQKSGRRKGKLKEC